MFTVLKLILLFALHKVSLFRINELIIAIRNILLSAVACGTRVNYPLFSAIRGFCQKRQKPRQIPSLDLSVQLSITRDRNTGFTVQNQFNVRGQV